MDIIPIPPFTCGSIIWQEQPTQWSLTIVCKITYSLLPGTATVSPEQEPITEQDNHWDDNPERSVYAPSDLVPYKPQPEVLLVGSAFAPRGEPVRSLYARLIVGSVDKSIEVFCPRTIASDGALSEGSRFTKMPLRYERAFGGEGTENPVGIDPSIADPYGKRSLPNLQPPGLLDVEQGSPIPTIGFGPLAARWAKRREKLGPLAAAFASGIWTETPLGMDFDGSYFQSAPDDQRVEELRPDEPIVLENLHPHHERIATRLPGIRPRTRVEIEGMPPWELDLVPDTLWIDTDRAICTVTFRGQLPLDGRDQPGRIFIGIERPQEPVQFPEAPPPKSLKRAEPYAKEPEEDEDLTQTELDLLNVTSGHPLPFATTPALPFERAPAAPQPPMPPMPAAAKAPPPRPLRAPGDPDETSIFIAPTMRGRMPTWLEGAAAEPAASPSPPMAPPLSAAPPMAPPPLPLAPRPIAPAPAVAPAPPPPVSQMLRSGEPAPFNLVSASDRAAGLDTPPRPAAMPLPGIVVPPNASTAPPLPPVAVPSPRASQPGTTVGQAAVMAAAKAQAPAVAAAPEAPLEKERPRPSTTDPRLLATAALLGAAEASNAAVVRVEEEPEKKASSLASQPEPRGAGRILVDVLWFAPELPPRLPENQAWKRLLTPEEPPKEPEPELREIPDEEWSPDAPQRPSRRKMPERVFEKTPEEKAKEEKSHVSRVLSRAQPTLDVEQALFAAVNDDGVLEPPLVLVSGELEIPFDEVETLKVVCAAAAPLAGSDKKLKETLDLANEALGTPLGSSPEVAANFSVRVRDAWGKANKYFAPDYLDIHTKRVLLEQRKYQMRKLAGATWIRALLHAPMSDRPVPTYLPEDLKEKLPLFLRFSARLVVEVRTQQDQNEAHAVALCALALARTVTAKPKR